MQFDADKMRDYISEYAILENTFNELKTKMTEVQALKYIFHHSCANCGKVDENNITCSFRNRNNTFILCEDCYKYVNGYES